MNDTVKTAAALREELRQRDAASAKSAAAAKRPSARQTIEAIVDEGTFAELSAFVKRDIADKDYEGVLCGYGAIDSRLVFLFAQDFERRKGAFDARQAQKICDLYALAMKSGAPVIGIFNSAGAVIEEGVEALGAYGKVMQAVSKASGVIPQIAYIPGVCAGSAAVIAAMFDIAVCVKDATAMYVNPPTLLNAKNAGTFAFAAANGLISKVYATAKDAAIGVRTLVNYLPQNNQEGTVYEQNGDDANRAAALPDLNGNYDSDEVLKAICDNAQYTTLSDGYAPEAICALASIGGTVCGIVANRASENGGKLTPMGARKFAKFISMCDSFSIPLVTFVDSEGVAVGDEYENAPFAAELSKLAYAYATAETAKVTVVLGKAYGSAYTLMGSKAVGADVSLALDSAKISIMSPRSAVAFLCNEKVVSATREKVEADWAAENATAVHAAVHGEIDDIIDASEARMRICASLFMLASKCSGTPDRKHPNMPL